MKPKSVTLAFERWSGGAGFGNLTVLSFLVYGIAFV
jgi:hypothetical protein